jgi:hypothetical protein
MKLPSPEEKDSAIEFGRYLADAAEAYLKQRNIFDEKQSKDECDTADIDMLSDHFGALHCAIGDFRKRAALIGRVSAATPPPDAVGDLLKLAARVARREYLPSLERCHTICDARIELSCMDDRHGELAMQLKDIWNKLKSTAPELPEKPATCPKCGSPEPSEHFGIWQMWPCDHPFHAESAKCDIATFMALKLTDSTLGNAIGSRRSELASDIRRLIAEFHEVAKPTMQSFAEEMKNYDFEPSLELDSDHKRTEPECRAALGICDMDERPHTLNQFTRLDGQLSRCENWKPIADEPTLGAPGKDDK